MRTVLHTYGGSNHLQWADFVLLLGEHVGAFDVITSCANLKICLPATYQATANFFS